MRFAQSIQHIFIDSSHSHLADRMKCEIFYTMPQENARNAREKYADRHYMHKTDFFQSILLRNQFVMFVRNFVIKHSVFRKMKSNWIEI